MFTCCPECETCFRISEEQLALAKGLVRCGHCQKIFNGRENITAALPEHKPGEQTNDKRHEADPHDSGIFSAEFSSTAHAAPESPSPKDPPHPSSRDHFDRPSFFDEKDFADPFTKNHVNPTAAITAPVEDTDDLNDDWFLQDNDTTPEPELESKPAPENESYQYSDITDGLQEERDINDIFSDMHQQLELGISELEKNEPGTGVLSDESEATVNSNAHNKASDSPPRKSSRRKKQSRSLNDEDEINQAIDSIFNDSELSLYGEELADQDFRVEKEMLATFGKDTHIDNNNDNIQFEDEAVSLADLPHPLEGESPTSTGNPREQDVPRRLRDSLAIAEPEKTSLGKIFLGLLLALLLSATLLAQLALFRNIELVNRFPQTRPWLEQFCSYLPCRIHTQRDIDKISIVKRDIRAHPQNKKALQISATIINRADFNQPYPDILISLSDLTGSVVAERRFTPDDYLGSLNSPFLLMKSGTPIHIRIEVRDPGRDAVSFEFQFL